MKKRRRRRKPDASPPSLWQTDRFRMLAIGCGAIAVGIVIVLMIQDSRQSNPVRRPARPVANRAFDMNVYDVARKFLCSCGSCEDKELASCACPTAIEEKAFIDDHLKRGVPKVDVIRHLNDKYGAIKAEFVSLLTESSKQFATRDARTLSSSPAQTASADFSIEAHIRQIAKRFDCACNQCDHILAECSCEHPRGAGEMKAFIRLKIAQKRFSTEEIVRAVEREYGHLIAN